MYRVWCLLVGERCGVVAAFCFLLLIRMPNRRQAFGVRSGLWRRMMMALVLPDRRDCDGKEDGATQ